MWISRKMKETGPSKNQFSLGEVTGVTEKGISVQAQKEHRNLNLAGPWGIIYSPPNGTPAVVLPENEICIGTITEERKIEPGELLLFSTGGAEIYLKNNGEVVINGQLFAAKGN